ncbi:MAG: L-Ala-D/L-Glu epimerase [Verrucomicrobiota bacterium]|jgi:L-alanine-DL-glutamate epimerase-like enolase superfamily enzyme
MQLAFRRFDLKLAHRWMVASSQAAGGKTIYPSLLVELRDQDGAVGYGESSPSRRYLETVETSMEFLARVDASRLRFDAIEASMHYVESLSAGDFSAKGAINLALLDAAAKRARQTVHEFLGLEFTEGKHLTSISIGIDAPDLIRRKTQEAESFPILKLKVGSPSDAENLAALRDVAPDKTVRVDANEAWTTKEEALERLEELARDPHIEFVEQPMPATSAPSDLAWLKERSPLPLVGDESYLSVADLLLCADCFHGVNVKLCKTGGISRALEALQAARRAGLKTMIGCMVESSILTSAGAHLASAADWLDLDGMLLITNDPFAGVTVERGVMSFAKASEPFGLRVQKRQGDDVESSENAP